MATVDNINEILDGHVVLDLECLDRILLNPYLATLEVGGEVANFLNQQRNQPIGSPKLVPEMGEAFRNAVAASATRPGAVPPGAMPPGAVPPGVKK